MNFAKDMSCEHADILSLTARQRYGSFFLRRELSGQSVPQNENFFSSSPGRCSSSADVRSASLALPFPRELSRREFALLYYAMLCFALCTLGRFFAVFRQKCFRFALFCYNYADNCNIFICRNGLRRLVVKRDCRRVSAAPDRHRPLSRQALPSVGSDTGVCRLRCRCLSVQAPVSVAL